MPAFTPPGTKPDHYKLFNARSETVAEKTLFSRLLGRRRAVVLVDGYYEWRAEGSRKQPYFVRREGKARSRRRRRGSHTCRLRAPPRLATLAAATLAE